MILHLLLHLRIYETADGPMNLQTYVYGLADLRLWTRTCEPTDLLRTSTMHDMHAPRSTQ